MENERAYNRATSWHIINLRASTRQIPMHYVEAIRNVKEQDPLIEVLDKKCISIRSMEECSILDNEGVPQWIKLRITYYTIVDANAFYNKREHRDVEMEWNEDIVTNKKEAELLIVPSVHKVVVRKNAKISLKNILKYLDGALNSVEEATFDVNVVVEHEFIQRVLSAHSIISFDAQISFSNPGHTEGFTKLFEDKVRDLGPDKFSMSARGTKEHPLNNSEDGIINAACSLAEQNGTMKAQIMETEESNIIMVDSKEHPRILRLTNCIDNVYSTLYNEVRNIFMGNNG